MLSARKSVKRKCPRVRKRSTASAPPVIDFDVVPFNPTLRLRRDPESHRSFSLRGDGAKHRKAAEGDANSSEGDRESWESPDNDEELSDSNDDDFYIRAVHSTFSNGEALSKCKSRSKRRSRSSSRGSEAPGTRLRNNLVRLGRYTKDVVKGVFPVASKLASKSDDAEEERENRCSHLVNSVVGLFSSKNNSEKEARHRIADTSASKNTNGKLMHYLTESSKFSPRSLRHRDRVSPSRVVPEYSTTHHAEITTDLRQDVTAPKVSANRSQRSPRSSAKQKQNPIEIASPETHYEEERYFEIPDTPRFQLQEPKIEGHSIFLGTSETATRIFLGLTVLLLAAVVYHFQLIAVMIFLFEMLVGKDLLPVMTGIAGFSTVVATCLIAERVWKH